MARVCMVAPPISSWRCSARTYRFKSRGYRTWRDPTGRWHVYRPDGTEITAA